MNGNYEDVKRYADTLTKKYKGFTKKKLLDKYYQLDENFDNLNNYAKEDYFWLECEIRGKFNGTIPDKL